MIDLQICQKVKVTDIEIYNFIQLPLDSKIILQLSLLLYENGVSLRGKLYNGLILLFRNPINWSIIKWHMTCNVDGKFDNIGDQIAQCDKTQDLQIYTTPILI